MISLAAAVSSDPISKYTMKSPQFLDFRLDLRWPLVLLCGGLFSLNSFAFSGNATGQEAGKTELPAENPEVQPQNAPAWATIVVPQTNDISKLEAFIAEIQQRQPGTSEQYLEMQAAIKAASETAIKQITNRTTKQFATLESAYVSSSVMLMGNDGPEAQQATMEQFVTYLKGKANPDENDLRMILLAGQNLEQLNQPELAQAAYRNAADVLEQKNSEKLLVWVDMLKANAKRLDSIGKPFKLVGKTLQGEAFDVDSLQGKFVLLYFFASWERSVPLETPYMKLLYEAYQEKGFEVVAISFDEDTAVLEKFVKDNAVPWTVLANSGDNATVELAQQHGIYAIPALILLDKEGRVVHLEARGLVLGKLLEQYLGPVPMPDNALAPPTK